MSDSESSAKNIAKVQDENTTDDAVVTRHTVDNITYTVISRSSEKAAQTLQAKLEAIIGNDIAKMSFD
jgi:hypothetical protein